MLISSISNSNIVARIIAALSFVTIFACLLPNALKAANECTPASSQTSGKLNASAFDANGKLVVNCQSTSENYPNGILYRIEQISGIAHTNDGFDVELTVPAGVTIDTTKPATSSDQNYGINVNSNNRNGIITIVNNANISSEKNSIYADGRRNIKVTNAGALSSGEASGIFARNRGYGEINIDHSGSIVTTQHAGIYAWYSGKASNAPAGSNNRIVIRSSGDITVEKSDKTARHGILAHGSNSNQDITIDIHVTGGTIRTDDDGINANTNGPKASAGEGLGTIKVVVDKGVKIHSNTEDGIQASAKSEDANSKDSIYIKSNAEVTSFGIGIYAQHFGQSSEGSITIISGGDIKTTGYLRRDPDDKEYEYTNFRGVSNPDDVEKVNSHGIYAYASHESGTIPIKIDMTGGSITSTGDGIHVRNEGKGKADVRVASTSKINAQGYGIRIVGKGNVKIEQGARVYGKLGAVSVNNVSSSGYLVLPSSLLKATPRLPLLARHAAGPWVDVDTRSGSTSAAGISYDYRSTRLSAGYAMAVGSDLLIGAAVQYLPTTAKLPAGERLKGKGSGLAFSIDYIGSGWYAAGNLGWSKFKSDFHKNGSTSQVANNIKASQLYTELEAGYRFNFNEDWELNPRVNYHRVKVDTKSFADDNQIEFPRVSESSLGLGLVASRTLKSDSENDMNAYISLDIERYSPSNGGNYRFTDASDNDVKFEIADSKKYSMLKAQFGFDWKFGSEKQSSFGAYLGYADGISGSDADETMGGVNLHWHF